MNQLTTTEVASLDKGNCPDCQSKEFLFGPEGGLGTNIQCANPLCKSEFNIILGMAGAFGKERINYQAPIQRGNATPNNIHAAPH